MRTMHTWRTTAIALLLAAGCCVVAAAGEKKAGRNLGPVFRINQNTVANYSYNNHDLIKVPIRAIAIDFQGLSYQDLKKDANPIDEELAKAGVLVVQPWLGPWNWSNFQAIRETDLIVDATLKKYNLGRKIPIVVYGRSMGGLSAYNYALYGRFPVKAIAGNCPVTDFHFHATERPDVARGIYRAFAHYDVGVVMAVAIHCPVCNIDNLPNVPYFIVSSDADKSVNKEAHADKFVAALKNKGHNVEYLEVVGMEHCQFDAPGKFDSYPDVLRQYIDFIIANAK